MSQGGQVPLLKPAQIDNLPHLSPELKAQYKHGLASLWQIWESNAEGSKERNDAELKIRTASSKLMQQLATARSNGGRPGSGGGQVRPNQPQQGSMLQQQQMAQQGNPQQLAQAQAQAQIRAQALAGQQAGQANGQRGGPNFSDRVSERSREEIDAVVLVQPPNINNQQWEAYKTAWQREAMNILGRRDVIMAKARQMQGQIQTASRGGQEVPQQVMKQFEDAKKGIEAAIHRWKAHKAQGEGQSTQQQQQQQQQQSANGIQNQRPGTQQGLSTVQQAQQQSDTKPVNMEQQQPSLSPPRPQSGFQQPQAPSAQNQQGTPVQQVQQNTMPGPQQTQQQQQQQAQPTPQSATQPQPTFPQQNVQQQQAQNQQARPQINTQLPQNQMGVQQSTPASAAANIVNQQNIPRPPQALNHQQAMSQAAENYSRTQQAQAQQQQTPQAQPQVPNGLPFNQQPSSATQQNAPHVVYPNLQTTQTSSANTKFPIPKTLSLDPRTQTAVAGPPSRPTLNAPGMMYVPGVQRAPPYTLEGEGDRVLSKRKLDELVRQVTGAAPSSDNSESSSVLSPEVEESMLQVTDDFVDNVITGACRLAKLRPNQTLDIRDIQMVLERNYGIRIPGYSMDEVRTVRKFQPAPGWQTKMQAVQAGKVMGNKDS